MKRKSWLKKLTARMVILSMLSSFFMINTPTIVKAATTITNPSFESGNLNGWTTVSGTAFSAADVTTDTDYWNLQKFNQHNFWHIWGGKGDNSKVGVMKSETFTVGGNGLMDFLIGGNNDINNLYVALVRNSDGVELLKSTGSNTDAYSTVNWDASAYIGTVCYIKIVDSSTSGHINIDDVNVPPAASLNNHVEPAIYNHDFEYTDLVPWEIKGWINVSGDAFAPSSLTHETNYSQGGKFLKNGSYHLWGAKADGDGDVGVLKSETFTLSGNGGVDFLIGGGKDSSNLYVALVRASDGTELFKETGRNSEMYQRVFWDAAAYIGQDLYIKIVDNATGGWGHINADDFHVLNSQYAGGLLGHWKLDENTGKVAAETVTGTTDPIEYHLNTGVYQSSQDPLWKSDGISNSALLFDGYSTWITRTPDKIPVPQKAITVEAWVAPRNFEHGDEGRLSAIVSQGNREAKEGYILGNFRHGTWGFQFGTGSNWREVMSDTLLPLNEWSYIVATYESATGMVALYQNGKQVATANFPPGEQIVPSATDLLIGKNSQSMWLYGYSLNMFSGLMDEVKIRNLAMGSVEVEHSYSGYVTALGGNLPTANVKIDRSVMANDTQRPQFHAEPSAHWQNEPGGAIYFNGLYHIFYQSAPRGPYWNHIRWGHMVSSDMVKWRDAEDSVIPGRYDVDPEGAWAGGAVVDDNGVPTIFYTAGDDRKSPNQRVNIARSNYPVDQDNDLNQWNKNMNVVVDQQAGQGMTGEFRDPFVFKDGNEWFMLVTSGISGQGGTALVYSTTDSSFQSWTYRGPLYTGNATTYPLTGQVWELPQLLPLGTSGKHIFMINPAKMAQTERQSRYTWYWIGTWNKTTATFTPDNAAPQLFDVGDHFTGPAAFNTPDGRTVIYTIAQGRRTATMDYNAGYAHNFGLPLSVYLRQDGKLGMEPISELNSLRGTQLVNITTDTSYSAANTALSSISSDMLEIEVEIDPGSANEVGLSVRRSPNAEEETIVYYKKSSTEFWVNRTKSSLNPDVEKWYQGGIADIGTENIKLRTFIDRSMVESYLNGLKALTTRAYPTRSDAKGIRIWANSDTGTVVIKKLKVWEMNSAYPAVNPTSVSLPSSKTIINGDSQLLRATVTPADASNKDVIWTSSNNAVASVVNGKVTAKSVGTATITAKTRIGNFTATSAITVTAEPAHEGLINGDFDDNLSGWTVLSGNAFSSQDVTDANDWGWGGPFNQHGSYHLWGGKDGGDSQTGSIRSQKFVLGGNGQINFLVGGGNNIYDEYVALVRSSDGKELFKVSGGDKESYTRVYWDASDYIGVECYIKVVDNATGGWGHINVDDFQVPVQPPTTTNITNPDFETGSLSGWTIVSGTAFNNLDVSTDTTYWTPARPFNHNGTYHMWGFKDGGDSQVGVMKSSTFTLYGTGWIDFLIGGGNDLSNEYVALVRASDGAELMKATGYNDEGYTRLFWDASAYIGEQVYIKVVDNATGAWGHINVDDFHVYNTASDITTADRYEQYRPQLHFSPDRKWMNDPNGLVYYDGEYHLFYQHNPTGTTWGPMSWGHAVSTDMVNWQDLPIALEPDANGFIWSGSVVVDTNNTSGFQTGTVKPMVAMFTHESGGTQVQSIAYSNDKGRTWTKYASNPVITMPAGLTVFRDPKVFWHAGTSKWVMVISAGDRVQIYTSSNLKSWTYASEFGSTHGSHAGTWEVPDLFPLAVDGNGANTKWVMTASISNGAPAGGSGTQYFVGSFNGTTFTNDNSAGTVLWADLGSDFYAGISFSDIPAADGRRIMLSWMNNWNYGQSIPTSIWRSSMTIPRELKLTDTGGGAVRMTQTPVAELSGIRGTSNSWTNQTITPGSNLISGVTGNTVEIVAEFQNNTATATEYGFKVRKGGSNFTTIAYNKANSKFFVDRTASGESHFDSSFAAKHEVTMSAENNKIKMRIFVDRSSIEAFGNDGKVSITDQIFPDLAKNGLELYSTGGNVTLNSLTIYQLGATTELLNHDFESGDLTGWTVVSGTAFSNKVVSEDRNWGWGGLFNKSNVYHLWGYKAGDAPVGVLKSANFIVGGSGKIDFLIGGGNNLTNLYVALVRVSDGVELLKATGANSEALSHVIWDAAAYKGVNCYIKIVDNNTGGWGHLNVDDINVPVK
ncbi:GH32 C-terminal domain-containing protein [Paenibacillus prosopidis]|uniref:Sucrose-6-phosphate hydrolase SacC (GH32 family) n=1 Tax=Paenibacillus prosopidis TaxID=630520 RepID=A0A368WE10_9BACL|nr:GH32 C-terminal domain-containing protein [Paenibacillus prosopidis]RCW51954.1 sucrose-6-phosphate hydrolase SacC (GH32 family) [Paenibacillus prosopidis]